MTLHDDEHIALQILARHEPGRVLAGRIRAPFDATDAQALALAQRVEGQADVAADADVQG